MRTLVVGLLAIAVATVTGQAAAQAPTSTPTFPAPLKTFGAACATAGIALPNVLPVQDDCGRRIKLAVDAGTVGATTLKLKANAPRHFPVEQWIHRVGSMVDLPYRLSTGDNRTLFLEEGAVLTSAVADGTKAVFIKKTGCNKWKFIESFAATTDTATSQVATPFQNKGKARLFQWKDGKTICWYLYRGDGNPPLTNVGNGTLCFHTDTCAVCALDTDDVKRPVWGQLKPAPQLKGGDTAEACFKCHAAGTISVKSVPSDTDPGGDNTSFFARTWRKMKKLNQTCAKQKKGTPAGRAADGPHWISPPTTWTSDAVWGDAAAVAAPGGCQGGKCHDNGFVNPKSTFAGVGTIFCELVVKEAFGTGGAMNARLNKFASPEQCVSFSAQMSCTPSQFNCPATRTPTATPTSTPTNTP